MEHLTERTFGAFVNKGGKVLVDFWATWCGPCRMQGKVLDELDSELGSQIGKVNVDEEQGLAAKFGVMSIPTLLVFENGEIVDQMVGLRDAAAIRNALK